MVHIVSLLWPSVEGTANQSVNPVGFTFYLVDSITMTVIVTEGTDFCGFVPVGSVCAKASVRVTSNGNTVDLDCL
jgi:hypothetical protein